MLEERLQAEELMDDPALPEEDYVAAMRDLAAVNRLTLAYRPTLQFLARAAQNRSDLKVLDVGFGDGDMLRQVRRFLNQRQVENTLVGIDLNPRSLAAARAKPSDGIEWRIGDYAELAGEGWDCVISSLVAHHMSREQLLAFLRFMEAEARVGWFVNDLHRHGFAFHGYPLLARLMGWHPIVRQDGRTSIARSYRPAEWPPLLAEAGVDGARVFRAFPFRLCVEKVR